MMKESLARRHMIENQIFTNKVSDENLLNVLHSVPREEFVPENLRGVAYIDEDLPLGDGRFLMEPVVFARLVQLAEIKKNEKVLVVGAATGYAVAIIAQLAHEVIGLENNLNLIATAQTNLKKLDINNASFVKEDLSKGAERQKPFDVIFMGGAVEQIPKTFISQLKDNGRIIAIQVELEQPHGPFSAVVIRKQGKIMAETKGFQVFTKKLPEFNKVVGFKF